LVNTTATTIKGASNLTIYATAALLNDAKITATSPAYTGSLTLQPAGNGTLDFSDVLSPSTGVRRVNIPTDYASTITLNELNTGAFTVGVAATVTGTGWAVAQAGSGQSDAVTVSFGSAATGSSPITATSIESLTLAGGTAAAGTLTLGSVTLTNGAGTQTVTITNAGNVAFTTGSATITADTVTATGVAGTFGTSALPLVLANTAGVSFVGGAGNTFVTGSAAADSITTGIGNDTVAAGGGDDVINTGAGNDVVTDTVANVAAQIINLGSGADTVTAGGGIDTIDLGLADAAADTVVLSAIILNTNRDVITNFATTIDKVTIGQVDTTLTTAAGTAPVVTASTTTAVAGGAVAYTSSVATNAADVIIISVSNTVANGDLAASATGLELLRALTTATVTTDTVTDITAIAASKGYIMATQNGTTYLYYFANDGDTTLVAAEILLVGTFTGATLVAGDFTVLGA
jgi:hypothetical protein